MRSSDLGALLQRAERWLLPGACLLCQELAGDDDPLICSLCRGRWRRVPAPWCERCGQPLVGVAAGCRICAAWPEGFVRARSAVWLDEGSRLAVHQLKYGDWPRLAETLALPMRTLDPMTTPGILLPIPLGAGRARRRGYNQAERLARALADLTGMDLQPGLLRRVRESPSQTVLAPEARRANIAGAFVAEPMSGARVVLVDDVFTTGATLAEAARAVAEAGAGRIEAVTFARARPPLD